MQNISCSSRMDHVGHLKRKIPLAHSPTMMGSNILRVNLLEVRVGTGRGKELGRRSPWVEPIRGEKLFSPGMLWAVTSIK